MRVAVVIVLAAGMLLVALPQPTEAKILSVSTGIERHYAIWQTSPPAFSDSGDWLSTGVSVLLGRFNLDFGAVVIDFAAMKLAYPQEFFLRLSTQVASILGAGLEISIEPSFAPAYHWATLYLGFTLSSPSFLGIEVFTSLGADTVVLSRDSPYGTAAVLEIGMAWNIPLF